MTSTEEQRIKGIYQKRDQNMVIGFRSVFSIIESYYRDRALLRLIKKLHLRDVSEMKIIDFGSGTGARLRELIRFGAVAENLYGVDLSEERIAKCRQLSSDLNVSIGSCTSTGFPDSYFDVVINSTMMSSVLDDEVAGQIAIEMCRVVKTSGFILWYDIRIGNPWNKNVRGYDFDRIRTLFPRCELNLVSLSIPSKLQPLIEAAPYIYHLIHFFPIFRTHYFGVLKTSE